MLRLLLECFIMSKRFWTAAFVFCGLTALVVNLAIPPAAPADDPMPDTPEAKKAASAGEGVRAVIVANELVALGRKTKNAEDLVTAARLLRGVMSTPSKDKPKIEYPEGLKPSDEDTKDVAPASLIAESDKLLAEAAEMAKDDEFIQKMIERVKKMERAALGGPRSYTQGIRRGVTHTYHVNMAAGTFSRVAVSSPSGNTLTLRVVGDGGVRAGESTGPAPSIVWTPTKTHGWTIYVTNDGPGFCNYTLYHN
jgi:hypothetical protein